MIDAGDAPKVRKMAMSACLSVTVITYDDNAQVNLVRQQVNERLRSVDLPPGVEANIAPNATPVGEVMRYRVKGDGKTTAELRTLEDWVVERSLRQVPGVADVVAMGGFIKQYEVQPDLDKLRAYKLSFQNVLEALGRGNANAGGSYVTKVHSNLQFAALACCDRRKKSVKLWFLRAMAPRS